MKVQDTASGNESEPKGSSGANHSNHSSGLGQEMVEFIDALVAPHMVD